MGIDDGRRRRGGLFAAVAGLVVLVAVTAGAVVALGSSSPSKDSAASATPSAAASSRTAAASAPASSAPAADRTGAPGQSVTGHVKNGVHSGDLRFFLLPPPRGADVYGDKAGAPLSADDIAAQSPDQSAARRALTTYGFRGGAYRTYLTADGVTEVTVRLARFAGPGQAAGYYSAQPYQGAPLTLGGAYPARGYDLASGSAESADTLLAVSYEGDVHITVTVTGGKASARALLGRLLDAQYQRLKTGR